MIEDPAKRAYYSNLWADGWVDGWWLISLFHLSSYYGMIYRISRKFLVSKKVGVKKIVKSRDFKIFSIIEFQDFTLRKK